MRSISVCCGTGHVEGRTHRCRADQRAHAQAGINVWTSHGPGVAGVTALAIDPTTPSTLYAGTYQRRVQEHGRRRHAGRRSTPACPTTPSSPRSPSIPPRPARSTPRRGGGVFKSTDGASTWNAVNTGLPGNTSVTALAIDPTTPSTLYAATYGGGVYKSTDGAGSSVNAGSSTNLVVSALAIDPTARARLRGNGTLSPFDPGGVFNTDGDLRAHVEGAAKRPSLAASRPSSSPPSPSIRPCRRRSTPGRTATSGRPAAACSKAPTAPAPGTPPTRGSATSPSSRWSSIPRRPRRCTPRRRATACSKAPTAPAPGAP